MDARSAYSKLIKNCSKHLIIFFHFLVDNPPPFFSEDFIAGFVPSDRMSVVRRFFCLFVTFDLVFTSLLWLICVVITGENIYEALEDQIVRYSIETSLFDVVAAAGARFVLLTFFYGILKFNHWTIIALTTTGSCGFLIAKVFFYAWPSAQQPVFQVFLIIISFVISWFEAWFLDSRMIPQEQYSLRLTEGKHFLLNLILSTKIVSRSTKLQSSSRINATSRPIPGICLPWRFLAATRKLPTVLLPC